MAAVTTVDMARAAAVATGATGGADTAAAMPEGAEGVAVEAATAAVEWMAAAVRVAAA